ncbi:MAG: thioredoxin family protein [Bacteroidia bacterium]|nr:thioredoxin family protein [Bacteroidia bacterium]
MAVVAASDTDFAQQLTDHDKVVVKYFADWCGTCKLIASKYRALADKPEYAGVVFLDVNAEESPEARKQAGVNNLPFFATFKNGQLTQADFTSKIESVEKMVAELL